MSLKKGDKIISGLVTIDVIKEMFYPVGSVVMGDNLVDENAVKSIYGGVNWQQITGALYGVGDQISAVGDVSEQMPMMTFNGNTASHGHGWTGTRSTGTIMNRGDYSLFWDYNTTQASGPFYFTGKNVSGGRTDVTSSRKDGSYLNWDYTPGGTISSTDITPSGSVNANGGTGVMVSDGHIMAKGIATYAWKRTA